MTGERLLWHRVAFHLKRTVGELKEQITLSEFFDWLRFLEIEETRRTKQDYYLAQVAMWMKIQCVKNPERVRLQDMLLDLSTSTATTLTPEEIMRRSKAAWAGATGANLPKE